MFKRMNKTKAQSLVEYSVMIIIILAVLLSMKEYIKRAFMGKYKNSVDDMGTQYDPRTANTMMNYVMTSSSNTFVDIVPAQDNGYFTKRIDVSNTVETKGSQSSVGQNPRN